MITKKSLLLTLCLALGALPLEAKKPTSFIGKVGAGIIQFTHRHSYLLTLPLIPLIAQQVSYRKDIQLGDLAMGTICWLGSASMLKTATKIIMNNCDIDPIKE